MRGQDPLLAPPHRSASAARTSRCTPTGDRPRRAAAPRRRGRRAASCRSRVASGASSAQRQLQIGGVVDGQPVRPRQSEHGIARPAARSRSDRQPLEIGQERCGAARIDPAPRSPIKQRRCGPRTTRAAGTIASSRPSCSKRGVGHRARSRRESTSNRRSRNRRPCSSVLVALVPRTRGSPRPRPWGAARAARFIRSMTSATSSRRGPRPDRAARPACHGG